MGQLQTVPVPQTPAGGAPPAAIVPTDSQNAAIDRGGPSRSEYLKFVAFATLGATFGFLTGAGLWSEFVSDWRLFVLQAIIAGLGAIVLFDPGMELLQEKYGTKRIEPDDRKLAAIGVILVVTLLMSAFHHSLASSLGAEFEKLRDTPHAPVVQTLIDVATAIQGADKFEYAILVLFVAAVCVGVAALITTCAWVWGAKRHTRCAAWLGAMASLPGAAVIMAATYFLVHYYHPFAPLIPVFDSSRTGISIGVLMWLLGSGVLGGLAIDKRLDPLFGHFQPPFFIRALFALAIFALVFVATLLLGSYKFSLEVLASLVAAQLIFQSLGWGFGMHLHGKPLAKEWDPSAIIPPSGERERRSGLALVPPSGGASSVATDLGDGLTPGERAKGMLLRPKGERLWASIALVLALVVAAMGTYIGTFRKDPEIVINIEQRFQLDSGLHDKHLTILSNGHIVTISGVVDNEVEHQKAVQEAASVRGVKQLVDRIQVVPPAPPAPAPAPPAAATITAVPVAVPAPSINATISLGGSAGTGKSSSANAQKAAQAQKHQGLFHLPGKNKNNQASASAQKQTENPKSADVQKKQGLFHFLKKNKDDSKNNSKDQKAKTKGQQ